MPPSSNNSMKQIVVELQQALGDHVAEIAMEIQGELVENPPIGTPVDTGFASASWWPKIGSPPTGVAANTSAAESQQRAAIASIASYKIGQSIWVTNNAPYVGRLNAGWSSQSPQGFIEAAIQTVLNENKRKVLNK